MQIQPFVASTIGESLSTHSLKRTMLCQERYDLQGLEFDIYDDNNEGKSGESRQAVRDASKPQPEILNGLQPEIRKLLEEAKAPNDRLRC